MAAASPFGCFLDEAIAADRSCRDRLHPGQRAERHLNFVSNGVSTARA
jgi:hypothetical protein